MDLFKEYSTHQSGFLEIFREEVQCSAKDFEVSGSGDDQEFQRLSKACPACSQWNTRRLDFAA